MPNKLDWKLRVMLMNDMIFTYNVEYLKEEDAAMRAGSMVRNGTYTINEKGEQVWLPPHMIASIRITKENI